MVGEKFGRWTVIANGPTTWKSLCVCACGVKKIVPNHRLKVGGSKSCGCLKKEGTRWTHGQSNTRLYAIWCKMIERCENKNCKEYPRWGGRGITMCREWRQSFSSFARDMGPLPAGKSIDRIDNQKGYSKENCRWATAAEQALNRRSNRLLTFEGQTKTLKEWAEEKGLKYDTLRNRIVLSKWSTEKALTTPPMW